MNAQWPQNLGYTLKAAWSCHGAHLKSRSSGVYVFQFVYKIFLFDLKIVLPWDSKIPVYRWNQVYQDKTCSSRVWNKLFGSGANRQLTEKFWSPARKFWLPNYFIYNLHKNSIQYITLHARKVTIEEQKQFETTQVTPSYKATVVLKCYVSGPKFIVVFIVILNEATHTTF